MVWGIQGGGGGILMGGQAHVERACKGGRGWMWGHAGWRG